LEGLHDVDEFVAREVGGGLEAGQVFLEGGEAAEEGLCGWEGRSACAESMCCAWHASRD